MKRALLILVSLGALSVTRAARLEETGPVRGQAIAQIEWTDDAGKRRDLAEFAGYPVILLPIYSRCPGPCVRNVASLKSALADTNADPKEFRVLLFSFDDADTPEILRAFRANERVPLGWSIGTSDRANIRALTESIGFQYGKAGGEFIHPDLLIFLDARMKIAKWMYGTNYRGRDLESALKVAEGRSDWVGRWGTVLYGVLLFMVSVFLIILIHLLLERRRLAMPVINLSPAD